MVGPTNTATTSQTLPPSSTTTPSGNDVETKVDAYEVGWQFVQQYYTMLHYSPEKLSSFYAPSALLIRGSEGEAVPTSLGTQEIRERIKAQQYQDCKVLISNVDAQGSVNGTIVVQVMGELANRGGLAQRFIQTVCLAESQGSFSVVNDIFRFIADSVPVPSSKTAAVPTVAPEATKAPSAASKAASAPQQQGAPAPKGTPAKGTVKSEEVKKEPSPATATAPATTEKPADNKSTNAPPAANPEPKAASSNSNIPKSWANITSSNNDKWDNKATAPVSGVVVAPVAPAKAASPQITDPKSNPRGKDFDSSIQLLVIRGVKDGANSRQLFHEVLSTFGEIRNLELVKTFCNFEYTHPESAQKALKAGQVTVGNENFTIEIRRPIPNNNMGNSSNRQQGGNPGFDNSRRLPNNNYGGPSNQNRRGGHHQHQGSQSLDHGAGANFDNKGGHQRRQGGGSHGNPHRNSTGNRGGSRSNTPAMQQHQQQDASQK